MKQIITINQLNELSKEQKIKLFNWWVSKGIKMGDNYYLNVNGKESIECFTYNCNGLSFEGTKAYYEYYPLLNIGQMIELLDDYNAPLVRVNGVNKLCDFLWKEIKKTL